MAILNPQSIPVLCANFDMLFTCDGFISLVDEIKIMII